MRPGNQLRFQGILGNLDFAIRALHRLHGHMNQMRQLGVGDLRGGVFGRLRLIAKIIISDEPFPGLRLVGRRREKTGQQDGREEKIMRWIHMVDQFALLLAWARRLTIFPMGA